MTDLESQSLLDNIDMENNAETDDEIEQIKANTDENETICRICQEEEPTDQLFQPCRCRGSIQWVHMECLNQWRACCSNSWAESHCMECNYKYRMINLPETRPSICSRMVQFLARQPFCFYLLNQISILGLTFLIQFLDTRGIINHLFNPFFKESETKSSFWSFDRKGNYIFASLIVIVFWILIFILNLIFHIRKRRLYLSMFFKTLFCTRVLVYSILLFVIAIIYSPIIGTLVLTLFLQIFLVVHYSFMDEIQTKQLEEILPYDPCFDEAARDSVENSNDYQTDDSDEIL